MTDFAAASTPSPTRHARPLLRTVGTLLWAWVACALAYLLGIVLAATVADSMPPMMATGVALVLVALQAGATFAAVVWVHKRLLDTLATGWRWTWVVAFAVLQMGTCGIAAITALLALNH